MTTRCRAQPAAGQPSGGAEGACLGSPQHGGNWGGPRGAGGLAEVAEEDEDGPGAERGRRE